MERNGTVIEEMWTKPGGATLLGISRTVKAGKTVATEYMQIREEKGAPAFVAQTKIGGPATVFLSIKASDSEVVFSNPEHDYPQRVIYRKVAGGLVGRIEGQQNGKESFTEFPYRKVACE